MNILIDRGRLMEGRRETQTNRLIIMLVAQYIFDDPLFHNLHSPESEM